ALFSYRILNADGSESGQCGNGARCFMRFVRERGLTQAERVVVDARDGQMTLHTAGDGYYRVALGVPQFEPAQIPLARAARAPFYTLDDVAGQALTLQALSVGNPHAVLRVDDVQQAPVAMLGPALQAH